MARQSCWLSLSMAHLRKLQTKGARASCPLRGARGRDAHSPFNKHLCNFRRCVSLSMSRRAFTLVELLIVIAVICILAAIAVPAVSKIKSTAQRTACASNLRQVGMAYMQYFQDHNQNLPHWLDPSTLSPGNYYNPNDINLGQAQYLGAPSTPGTPYDIHTPVEISPYHKGASFLSNVYPTRPGFYKGCSYWPNATLWSRNVKAMSLVSNLGTPLSPGKAAMLCVAGRELLNGNNGVNVYLWDWAVNLSPSRFEFYGGDLTNVMFFDGHCELVAKGNLPNVLLGKQP